MVVGGRSRIIEWMAEPRDTTVDEEQPDSEEQEPEIFDVGRWAEAYLAEQPEIPLELVGVPFS